ncbi:MAG: alpha-E domain-containing protein [Methylocella sp.]
MPITLSRPASERARLRTTRNKVSLLTGSISRFAKAAAGIDSSLDSLAREDGRSGLAQRKARATLAALERAGMDDIFQSGLHEFITDFIEDNARLADTISEQYLFV